jgi:hypothetical protein
MNLTDSAGHALSGATPRAVDHLETALHQLRCYTGDPVASVDAALDASPELVMGHVLHAYLHLLGTEPDGLAVARESLRHGQALPAGAREAQHLAAIGHLVQWPLDALALQAGHQIDFFCGDSRLLHDRIARALPAWSPAMPGYPALLGMLAFGLEETGRYAAAERSGRRCVELQPRDAWGQHAVAHVLEMQGRRAEGVAWMRDNQANWSEDSFFAVHNWWHLALFHLGLDQIDETLALLDGPIAGGGSALVLDMIDASALMWRLQLRGHELGSRWQPLARRWRPMADCGQYAFNDAHAMMAFVSTGDADGADALAQAQARALHADADNAAFTREAGQPVTQAVRAFGEGRYADAVELLRPVRSQAHRFGGSHAQRDLIDQTLIEAARRAGQAALWRALCNERASAAAANAEAA